MADCHIFVFFLSSNTTIIMTANTDTPNTCPVQHTPPTTQKARCPVEHARQKKAEKAAEEANTTHGCPVDHETREEYLARAKASPILNPRNQMPELPQQPAEGQSVELSTERMISSIPKNEMKEKWEYPSPQQFYHALRRKGMEAPEHEMELMVDIHNFLNEACWVEILKWEELQGSGCDPLLLRFRGRPNTLSPKARLYTLFG
jgi:cytochrome c heme-lyase